MRLTISAIGLTLAACMIHEANMVLTHVANVISAIH